MWKALSTEYVPGPGTIGSGTKWLGSAYFVNFSLANPKLKHFPNGLDLSKSDLVKYSFGAGFLLSSEVKSDLYP